MQHFRFSTDDLNSKEAIEYWAEVVLPQLQSKLWTAVQDGFSCTMAGRRRAEIAVGNVSVSSYSGRWRENARLIGSEDSVRILRVRAGVLNLRDNRENVWVVAAGETFICGPETVLDYEIICPPAERAFIGDMTLIPLKQLSSYSSVLRRDRSYKLDQGQLAALFNAYVDSMRCEKTSDTDLKRLVHNFTEFVALTAQKAEPSDELCPVIDAHYERAQKLIKERCIDPSFDSRAAADLLGMSERTLFKVFEVREPGFHQQLVEERLALAARRLRAPMNAGKIIGVALDCGFDSITTFNRNFKRRFGISPSEYRDRALSLFRDSL